MLYKRTWLTLLFLTVWAGAVDAPEDTCGISLRPSAVALLHDVERRFGRPVHCSTASNLRDTVGGIAHSMVAGGTPTVTLDIFSGKTETSFVHELFHLQLRAMGFPQDLRFRFPPGIEKRGLDEIATSVSALIEHRLFFPKMRQMNFDPTDHFRKEVEELLMRDEPPAAAIDNRNMLVTSYAHIPVLIRDPVLTVRVNRWYQKNGWQEELKRGQRVAEYLWRSNPDTPAKKKAAFVVCMDIVLNTKITLL